MGCLCIGGSHVLDVIIPTKNCADDLRRCIASLRNQVDAVNIIVVDAHSTDGTRLVAAPYLVDEPPSSVKGSRRAVACNEGLRRSASKYVAFLDADAEAPPTWSRDLVKPFGAGVGGVTSGCVASDTPQGWIMRVGSPNHARSFTESVELTSLPGYNSVYLRAAIDDVGGFAEDLGGCEDYELNQRLLRAGWVLLGVPDSPVVHREKPGMRAFSRQIFGYGWSRGRLLRVKKQFTWIHAVPTVVLVLGIFILYWGIGYLWGIIDG
jgi:succinoglycan biosynthesis protein ExoA